MNLLRSKEATLAVLIIALIAQLPHAAYVFAHIGNQKTTWLQTAHSYSYAIALELAVLLFVVRNKRIESYGFAFVSVLINLSYYQMHNVAPFSLSAFPAWLVSVALPVAIACYSHDIADHHVAPSSETIDSFVVSIPQPLAVVKPTAAQRRETLASWLSGGIAINAAAVAKDFGVSAQMVRKELAQLRETRSWSGGETQPINS